MFSVKSRVQGGVAYSHDDKTVLLHGSTAGHDNTVTAEDLEHLQANQIFNLHKANGFIDITAIKAEEPEEEMLIGSSKQPSTFTLEDGAVLSLGDVVNTAFLSSGLEIKAWNKLADGKREKLIANAVAALKLKEEA